MALCSIAWYEPLKGSRNTTNVNIHVVITTKMGSKPIKRVPGFLCQICQRRATINKAIGTKIEALSSLQRMLKVIAIPVRAA